MVQHLEADPPARAMTLAEWAALPGDEPGELVDGRLVEDEVPSFVHEIVVSFLIGLLRAWAVPRGGFVGASEAKFFVGPRRGRKPDVFVYLPGRKLPGARANATDVPPDIMVEVVSPTPRHARRDRIEKTTEYAAFGVRAYWLVDPSLRSLEILELGADGRYAHAVAATDGVVASVPLCEGLSVDLDALWAEVDRFVAASGEETTDEGGEPG
jgi:Uma2 family endonuclease